jgi:EAL domain-containing protein (putative c-di-GMP-specific phosphodiesterase class I)
VLYQPKFDLRAERITSAEALIRWRHPVRGDLRPDIFIPLAEETNRIDELTLFVLRRVIDDVREWRKGGLEIRAAINISARLITSADFTARVESILLEDRVPADRLIFEITESATIGQFDLACSALRRFRDLGVGVSMDDYGTGQSTLSYLKRLPLTELKIDRSFVQHAHRDHADALLVSSTVELAHQLGLQVVAEGIEEEACLDFLREIGCDYAQGYFIARPMSADAFFDTAQTTIARAA